MAMLRVRRPADLIGVLGQVVRVAVMVPALERLRDVLPPSALEALDAARVKPLTRSALLAALTRADVASAAENVDRQRLREDEAPLPSQQRPSERAAGGKGLAMR